MRLEGEDKQWIHRHPVDIESLFRIYRIPEIERKHIYNQVVLLEEIANERRPKRKKS